jgi:crotonobetainyl-CoA:carnitine CoA-transferase CaiB-like acyl-CoA transferase
MRKVYIITLILASFSLTAHAEMFVCFDEDGNYQSKRQGDCMTLGLCSDYNNQGLDEDCIIASKEEYDKASKYTERDGNAVVGSRVKDMEQSEIDAINAAEEAAQVQADIDAWNAKIERVKEDIDDPATEYGLMMEVVTDIIQVEIQAIKDGTPNPKSTKDQLKAVAKQKLDLLKQ